jgi:hypothetical protein
MSTRFSESTPLWNWNRSRHRQSESRHRKTRSNWSGTAVRFTKTLLGISLLLVVASAGAWGQNEASLRGTVSDATGGVIPGAAVSVKNLETGAIRATTTDASGSYEIPLLAVGAYEVTAEKAGFRKAFRTGVTLQVGQHASLDLTLEVGTVDQVLQVEAVPETVNTSTTDLSGLVGERQVKDLPLNGRSFDNLLALNAGTINFTAERAGGVGTSASSVGNMFSVSGRRPQENLFLLNGIEYTGASNINVTPGGASGQLLGVDAIREFAVVKDTYGAAYGKRSGAQVNIVTTSGTNQLHGSAYEFLRNSALDARNYFDQAEIPRLQRNVFGGSLGGPIHKDSTFLFGNYEGFRQRLGLSNVTLVPDDAARASAIPSVQPLLDLWPHANGPSLGGGIAIAYNHPVQAIREDFGTTRLDHNFTANDLFNTVYTVDDSEARTPSTNPLSLVSLRVRNQVASLSHTHVFSPALINKITLGFSRAAYFFTGTTPVDVPGFAQGRPIGVISIGGSTSLNAAAQLTLAGTNGSSNLRSNRNLFTLSDQLSAGRGIHLFEFGFWLQKLQSNDNLAQNQYGQAVFSTLQDFLQGKVQTFTIVPSPTPLSFRSTEAAFYVEDTMKAMPSLELRLGFRAELSNGWNEAHGRAANYPFDSNGIIASKPLVGSSAFTVNRAKFLPAPRVGLAWSPISSKNVIRAGFGMYYNLNDSISYRLTQSAPFNSVLVLRNIPLSSIDIVPGADPPSGAKVSPAGVQPDLDTPTVISYSLKIEQEITPTTAISVGYIGNHGYHGLLSIDANLPRPTICPAAPCPAGYPAGLVYFAPGAPLSNSQVANTTHWFSWGNSNYNGLQVDLTRHARNLQFRGVYSFGKALDDGSSLNNSISGSTNAFTMNPLDPRADYGRSSFDARHSGVVNVTWNVPFWGKSGSWWRAVVRGWQISGIATAQSGLPFSPQLGFNPSNDGNTRNPGRPSLNPAFTGKMILGDPNRYFDPNAFVVPLNGTYGNAGRNILEGPGVQNVDISLSRRFPVTERVNLQFRSELFNLFNHTNFGLPNPIVFTDATSGPSSSAGRITSTTTTSRQIQFGVKLLW